MKRQVFHLGAYITLSLFIFAQAAQSQVWIPVEGWWAPIDGEVRDMVVDTSNDVLYIGGNFNTVARYEAYGARASKSSGLVDFNFQNPNGPVNKVIPDGQGGWFIGGEFDHVGSTHQQGLSRLDSNGIVTDFVPENHGLNGEVTSLLLEDSTLFVGGDFDAFGEYKTYFGVFDEGATALQSQWPNVDGTVYTIEPDGSGGWYLGGSFDQVGDSTRYGLAHVNAAGQVTKWNPNPNSTVFDIIKEGTTIYISGAFTLIGGATRNRIASIDSATGAPSSWTININNSIFDMEKWGDTIFIGGLFSSVGGSSRSGIAAVTPGSSGALSWNPSNSGTGSVRSLARKGDTLYLGGWFTTINFQARNRIAAIQISTASLLSWNPNANDNVERVVVHNNKVYAAGRFTTIGGQFRSNVAALNINTGVATSWNPSPNDDVEEILFNDTVAYLVGDFTEVDGQPRAGLAAYSENGFLLPWQPYSSGLGEAIDIGNGEIAIGGSPTLGGIPRSNLAAFNANTGELLDWAPTTNNHVNTMLKTGDSLIIGGLFSEVNGTSRFKLAAVKCSDGSLIPWVNNLNSGEIFDLALAGDTLYMCGSFTGVNNQSRYRLAAVLTSQNSSVLSWDPDADGIVSDFEKRNDSIFIVGSFSNVANTNTKGIAVISATSGLVTSAYSSSIWFNSGGINAMHLEGDVAYIGGDFTYLGSGFNVSQAAMFDFSTGSFGSWEPEPNDEVRCIFVQDSSVYLGGDFTHINSIERKGLYGLDLNTGDALPWDMSTNSFVDALALSGDTLYAGGGFSSVMGSSRSRLAAISLTNQSVYSWNPGCNGLIRDLEIDGNLIYVAGSFTTAGGQNRPNIAAIQRNVTSNYATAWNPSPNDDVNAIEIKDNVVYMGGEFTSVASSSRNRAAAVQTVLGNILPWNPNLNSSVYDMAVSDTTMFLGGIFLNVGGLPYSRVAEVALSSGLPLNWDPNPNSSVQHLDLIDSVVFVSGVFITVNGEYQPYAAHLNTNTTSNYLNDWQVSVTNGGRVKSVVKWEDYIITGGSHEIDEPYQRLVGFAADQSPSFTPIADQAGCPGDDVGPIPFSVDDENTATVNVTVSSSNQSIVLNANIQLSGSGGNYNLSYSTQPGAFGTTSITINAVDQEGNASTYSFIHSNQDTLAPVISGVQNITANIDNGSCVASNVALITPQVSDDCALDSLYNDAPSSFPIGQTDVTWYAIDEAGNMDSTVQVVTVVDNVNPQIIAPSNLTFAAAAGSCQVTGISLGSPLTNDNCGVFSVTNNAPVNFTVGQTEISWIVTDLSGNVDSAMQTVTVTENVNPSISAPADVNAFADPNGCFASNVQLGTPVSFDNCGVESISNDAPSTFPLGSTMVHWTATDYSGNTAVDSHMVTVTDTAPPFIIAPGNLTITASSGSCGALGVNLGTPLSADNCTSVTTSNNAPILFPLGTTIVTWTAIDAYGNSASATQNVTVVESTPPAITAPASIIANADSGCFATSINLGTASASDNCGTPTITNNAPGAFPVGSTTVVWTATDQSGNIDTAIQVVQVNESTPPVITAPINVSVNVDPSSCFATNVFLGNPIANDACSPVTVSNNAPSSYAVGTTDVVWTAIDFSGNVATDTQSVTVVDNLAPTITPPSNITIQTGSSSCAVSSLSLGSPVTNDNCAVTSVTNNAPTTFGVGITVVIWTAFDASGNSVSASQTVNVYDTISPTITAPASFTAYADANACYASNVALGTPTASDNCGVESTTNDAPTNFPIGLTTVTWTATDTSGNTATAMQMITVIDTTSPLITAPANVVIDADAGLCASSNVNLGFPSTGDNCTIVSTTNDGLANYPVGNTIVTWTVTDNAGNASTATQLVTVNDNEAPVPSVAELDTLFGECSVNISTIPEAMDNCSGLVLATTNDPLNYFSQGQNIIVWTFADTAGNEITQQQVVIIADSLAPTVDSCSENLVACEGETIVFGDPVGLDNCTGVSVTQLTGLSSGSVFPIGIDSILFQLADSNGNAAYCSFTVEVLPLPSISVVTTDAMCFNGATGTAEVQLSNSNGPVIMEWAGNDPDSLAAGDYHVTVTDSAGCSVIDSFSIDQPDPISVSIDIVNDSTGSCVGVASAFVTGGTAPYNYLWNDSTSQSTSNAFDLCIGSYCLQVTDSQGCVKDTCGIQVMIDASQPASRPNVLVYPNPTRNAFTLDLGDVHLDAAKIPWLIREFSGKVVMDGDATSNRTDIDVQHLATGIYFLQIQLSDGWLTRRIGKL